MSGQCSVLRAHPSTEVLCSEPSALAPSPRATPPPHRPSLPPPLPSVPAGHVLLEERPVQTVQGRGARRPPAFTSLNPWPPPPPTHTHQPPNTHTHARTNTSKLHAPLVVSRIKPFQRPRLLPVCSLSSPLASLSHSSAAVYH
eukprot:SAG31_NODE_834_length_11650_cov_7.572245_8_plen_143_part_00